jgi:hypothetical protein
MRPGVATLLLAASCSAGCFDSIPPGQVLFDSNFDALVIKSAPVPLPGKPRQSSQSAEQSLGDGRILFHSDYLAEVGFPRDKCGSFLTNLERLVSQRIKEKGASASGSGSGNQSRTIGYSRGRLSGSVEMFCLGDDTNQSHVAAVVDEIVLRGRG